MRLGTTLAAELGVGSGPPSGDGMAEFMEKCQHADGPRQPEAEFVGVQEDDQRHEHEEAGADVHVEAEQLEHTEQARATEMQQWFHAVDMW